MAGAVPKPQVGAYRIADLVELIVSGGVRIPEFQRGLRWSAVDVVALFESIYLGYPVGSLLFNRRPAPARVLDVGPMKVPAPETSSALWVVDGQQRLTALAVSLARPEPLPATPVDPFVGYFDAETQTFQAPPETGEISSTWVPLPRLLDPTKLIEWVVGWEHARDQSLRKSVFEAGARLREYTIPAYTVETEDEDVLREIFHRVNKYGKHLEWQEVHDALYGSRSTEVHPSNLPELADELAVVGMGRPDERDQLLRCLLAFQGLDVTRNFEEHYRKDTEFLAGTAAAALPTLRGALGFLRGHAGIPHLRLLPWSAPLTVLTRFFRIHPEPSSRSLQLLSRWLWRSILTARDDDERTFQRRGVSGIDADEEASIQRLLEFLPKRPREFDRATSSPGFELPARFDARSADSRIALLGLASLRPRDITTGHDLDVAQVIEVGSIDAFRRIVGDSVDGASSPANRVILPGRGLAKDELLRAGGGEQTAMFFRTDDQVLRSHAISSLAAELLVAGRHAEFIVERKRALQEQIGEFGAQMAEWESNDRPSIDYILEQADAEHGSSA